MDGLVLESAGCILGPLAKLVGGPIILNSLKPLINKLVSKIVSFLGFCGTVRELLLLGATFKCLLFYEQCVQVLMLGLLRYVLSVS